VGQQEGLVLDHAQERGQVGRDSAGDSGVTRLVVYLVWLLVIVLVVIAVVASLDAVILAETP